MTLLVPVKGQGPFGEPIERFLTRALELERAACCRLRPRVVGLSCITKVSWGRASQTMSTDLQNDTGPSLLPLLVRSPFAAPMPGAWYRVSRY